MVYKTHEKYKNKLLPLQINKSVALITYEGQKYKFLKRILIFEKNEGKPHLNRGLLSFILFEVLMVVNLKKTTFTYI